MKLQQGLLVVLICFIVSSCSFNLNNKLKEEILLENIRVTSGDTILENYIDTFHFFYAKDYFISSHQVLKYFNGVPRKLPSEYVIFSKKDTIGYKFNSLNAFGLFKTITLSSFQKSLPTAYTSNYADSLNYKTTIINKRHRKIIVNVLNKKNGVINSVFFSKRKMRMHSSIVPCLDSIFNSKSYMICYPDVTYVSPLKKDSDTEQLTTRRVIQKKRIKANQKKSLNKFLHDFEARFKDSTGLGVK